jgi:hypothetical protein
VNDDVMVRLEAANPFPPEARAWVADELRLDALRPQARPRLSRRRLVAALAAAAIVACGVLLVAPALGLGIPGIDFFHAEKAPARVVKDFASMSDYAPPGMDPGVIAGEARTVTTVHTARGTHTLWVAPTKLGGLCYGWSKGAGGCDARGVVPLAVTWMSPDGFKVGSSPPEFSSVEGHVHSPWADGAEIHLSDGSTLEPDVVWVSSPIDAGFFHYGAPDGVSIRTVVATKDGEAVDADDTGAGLGAEPVPSPYTLLDEKKPAATLDTSAGRATIWVAPTKTDKVCRWLQLGEARRPVTPCLPAVYGLQGLPVNYAEFAGARLLYGAAGPRYASIDVTFPDGHQIELRPKDGYFLREVEQPAAKLVIDARDDAGKVILPQVTLELGER